jgi:hypothetical protein
MLTEDEFIDRLRRLLESSRDPRLHDAIWSYREGGLDRTELLGHPAYQRHLTESWDVAVEALERRGGSLEELRSEARRLAHEHGYDEAVPDR